MDVGQTFGVGVAGHDDMGLACQQGFEGVEELLLRALLVGKKLHVIDQQQIKRVIAFLEFIKGLALIGFDHICDKLFGMDVENFGLRALGNQLISHCVHQMGLAQAHTTVDEKRVVQMTRHARHMHGRSARHAVGTALDQGIKSQCAVKTVFLELTVFARLGHG